MFTRPTKGTYKNFDTKSEYENKNKNNKQVPIGVGNVSQRLRAEDKAQRRLFSLDSFLNSEDILQKPHQARVTARQVCPTKTLNPVDSSAIF